MMRENIRDESLEKYPEFIQVCDAMLRRSEKLELVLKAETKVLYRIHNAHSERINELNNFR